MKKIVLQPVPEVVNNNTLEKSVSLEEIKDFFSAKGYEKLSEIYPSGEVKVWGIKSTKRNISKWSKVKDGDLVLFAKKGKFFASGEVTHKIHSKNLAKYLWRNDDDNETWAFIYLVKNVEQENIKVSDFNKSIGYKENYIVQGFNVLNSEKSFEALKFIYHKPIKKVDVEIWYGDNMECLVKVDGKVSSWSQIKDVSEVLNLIPQK